jgi:hypothetical protein
MQPYYYILIIYFKIWIRTTENWENTRNAAVAAADDDENRKQGDLQYFSCVWFVKKNYLFLYITSDTLTTSCFITNWIMRLLYTNQLNVIMQLLNNNLFTLSQYIKKIIFLLRLVVSSSHTFISIHIDEKSEPKNSHKDKNIFNCLSTSSNYIKNRKKLKKNKKNYIKIKFGLLRHFWGDFLDSSHSGYNDGL